MNDPRITQYALGELTGAAREEFERELASSETLQRELNETIKIADLIGSLPMPTETLTENRRASLRKQISENLASRKNPRRLAGVIVVAGALAACLAVALLLPAGGDSKKQTSRLKAELAPANGKEVFAGSAASTGRDQQALSSPVSGSMKSDTLLALQSQTAPAPALAGVRAIPEDKMQFASGNTGTIAPAAKPTQTGLIAMKQNEAVAMELADNEAWSRATLFTGGVPIDNLQPLTAGERSKPPLFLNRDGFSYNTEAYDSIQENVFLATKENPLSTFSIDVDTASYSNVRRFLQDDQLPPAGAVRTEELINYFTYDYPQPKDDAPFSINLEAATAPWDARRELVRIGLKGREIPASERGPANLVFLVDVSGSMDDPGKLPLLQRSLKALVENLSPKDRVAIAVYAGSSGLVLPSTPGTEKARIIEALENLKAGGSTNGGEGIKLAYNTARENLLKEGNNRVILCTDGDFNIGTTNQGELIELIEKERASGVFLSVLGFGTGNLKDSTMEKLADEGNGNYAYIDSLSEGRKVLVEQMGSTLFTIAKDVKIQVEFNPARVAGYRLIGYENRLLAKEDFNDDKKDAGEIGAGHTVTALYEIIPAGQPLPDQPSVDPLKYQKPASTTGEASADLLTVKLRYKAPDGDKSKLIEVPLGVEKIPAFEDASRDFKFASAVAAFGMKLRGSPNAGEMPWSDIQKIVRSNLGEDPGSYRAEFLTLIEKAASLSKRSDKE